jgi:hypothetical protein
MIHVDWYRADPAEQQRHGHAGLSHDDHFYPSDDPIKNAQRLHRQPHISNVAEAHAIHLREKLARGQPLNSHTFSQHDGFTGTHGNLADWLSAQRNRGKAPEALTARMGKGLRSVNRGSHPPERPVAESAERAWNRPELTCARGSYSLDLQDSGERLGMETPKYRPMEGCAKVGKRIHSSMFFLDTGVDIYSNIYYPVPSWKVRARIRTSRLGPVHKMPR